MIIKKEKFNSTNKEHQVVKHLDEYIKKYDIVEPLPVEYSTIDDKKHFYIKAHINNYIYYLDFTEVSIEKIKSLRRMERINLIISD